MQLPHIQQYNFHSIEINNEPVNSSINLEKGIAQILPCNRLSQHVPIHWLKVNLFFNSFRLLEIVYSNGLLSRMETDTPAQLMRRKPRPFFH